VGEIFFSFSYWVSKIEFYKWLYEVLNCNLISHFKVIVQMWLALLLSHIVTHHFKGLFDNSFTSFLFFYLFFISLFLSFFPFSLYIFFQIFWLNKKKITCTQVAHKSHFLFTRHIQMILPCPIITTLKSF
jgi:hypothetical protein